MHSRRSLRECRSSSPSPLGASPNGTSQSVMTLPNVPVIEIIDEERCVCDSMSVWQLTQHHIRKCRMSMYETGSVNCLLLIRKLSSHKRGQ